VSEFLTVRSRVVGSSPDHLVTFSINAPTLMTPPTALHRPIHTHTQTHRDTHTRTLHEVYINVFYELFPDLQCVPECPIVSAVRDVSLLLGNGHAP